MIDFRADSAETTPSTTRAPRVLLADDDAVSRKLLGASLTRSGFEVLSAADGEEALHLVATANPDLLVLDFEMPDQNGAEVCHQLRRSEREDIRTLPVIMLTAHAGEAEEVTCLEAGANDFVTKPVSREVLSARIQTQLRLRSLSDELRIQNEELGRWRSAQEADLAAAQATQHALIPDHMPSLEGWSLQTVYQPVIQVGGDVFGWQAMGQGRWIFWLADATGHGAAAALFTALAAQLFRRACEAETEPSAILGAVNREFRNLFQGRSFMTGCCALVEPDGHLRFCGAGHPPLLVRRASGEVESYGPHSTILGLFDGEVLEQSQVTLAKDDVALLYTDGLFSFQQPNTERFTHKALQGALSKVKPGTDLIQRVLASLHQDSDGTPSDDDIAAMALLKG